MTAALDLHRMAPAVAPVALEHLLRDVVAESTGQVSVEPADLAGAAAKLDVKPAFTGTRPTPGLLLDVLLDERRVGTIAALNRPMSAQQAAVVLFRDLQASRLVAASTQPGPL